MSTENPIDPSVTPSPSVPAAVELDTKKAEGEVEGETMGFEDFDLDDIEVIESKVFA